MTRPVCTRRERFAHCTASPRPSDARAAHYAKRCSEKRFARKRCAPPGETLGICRGITASAGVRAEEPFFRVLQGCIQDSVLRGPDPGWDLRSPRPLVQAKTGALDVSVLGEDVLFVDREISWIISSLFNFFRGSGPGGGGGRLTLDSLRHVRCFSLRGADANKRVIA